jgi:uncharacterized membrane protein YkoI
MKRQLLIVVLTLMTLTACGTQPDGTTTETYITEEKAKEIAFTHAAVTQDNVSLLRVNFDFDDWKAVYEVDFYSGNMEYDYDIDAITGDILGYDADQERFIGAISQTGNTSADAQSQTSQAAAPAAASAAPAQAPAANASSSNNSFISSTDAENAALSHAGVTGADVSFLRSHLDRDDGRTLYEVSFYYNYMEYEYDIDALTGNILSFDQDYD